MSLTAPLPRNPLRDLEGDRPLVGAHRRPVSDGRGVARELRRHGAVPSRDGSFALGNRWDGRHGYDTSRETIRPHPDTLTCALLDGWGV